jgi:hypothetical protein
VKLKGAILGLMSLPVSVAALAQADDGLTGEWSVDLRLSLDDAPYAQPMEIAVDSDGVVSGRFYGSPIESGKCGMAQGRTCIAFRTRDNSGPYQHSACMVDGKLVGQSWSEGRGFVNPWTAERKN